MKKLITTLMMALSLAGCSNSLHSNGATYEPYGLANEQTKKADNVCYSVSFGDVVMGIIFIETVFVPIYIVGWDMFEPHKVKDPNGSCKS